MRRAICAALLVACASPAVSTTPTATVTTSSPAPTITQTATPTSTVAPTPTPADPARYGYVMASESRIVVRGERAADPPLTIGGSTPAPSHDGKRIAFWRTGPQGNDRPELRIVDLASGTERAITTAPAGWNGGAIAWSNDDSGLLYEIDRMPDPNAPPGPPIAPPSRMFSIDLSAPSAQPVTHPALDFAGGLVFIPLAWDASAGVAAALTTGEGGYAAEWVVWDKKANSVKKTRFPWQILFMDVGVSANASMVLANDSGANALRFWPLADIGNVQTLPPGPDATVKSRGASWRPGTTNELVWVTGLSVSLYAFATDRAPTLVHRGQTDVTIMTWRADGSGLLLSENGRVFVVDLATGQETTLTHLDRPLFGGVLLR